jgi:hypothetical protein
VKKWNRWTPARHRKAADALVDRDLVVRDKRTRAGRTIFLHGPWNEGPAPIETWKHDLQTAAAAEHGSAPFAWWLLPDRFAYAWNRARTGPQALI